MDEKREAQQQHTTAFWSVGGRRFLLSVLMLFSINFALMADKMSDSIYRDIIIAIIGIYVAGNTVQKIKSGASPSA